MCDFFLFVYLLLILLKLLKVIYVSLAGNYITFSEDLYDLLRFSLVQKYYGMGKIDPNLIIFILYCVKASKKKVMREVKLHAKLEHSNIVRYFTTWLETPPPGKHTYREDEKGR